MTEGTEASSRITGSSNLCTGVGANSTMNTATNSDATKEIATAPAVVRTVLQISGHARNV
jgi:hypothetical protein